MKGNEIPKKKSVFWSRLLGLLIAFAIVAVMVVGGVKNLMAELSAVHEALSDSQRDLALTQHALDNTRAQLSSAANALNRAGAEVDRMGRKLEVSQRHLHAAGNEIAALSHENDHLKQRWAYTLQALAQRNEQLVRADQALRKAQTELADLRSQPQVSVVVTTERQMRQGYRESFAASRVQMFVESDAGMMFYDGREAHHEVEKYMDYSERTQVVVTTTAPGKDALRCLADASLGCATIIAASAQGAQMQAYSYQAQYSAMETLLVDGRRGRRPGRRR